MKISIANPIYDAVFKYLVEDERIARTLLSALLKKEVVAVETRPHEYSNDTKDNKISMFRIDFAATVREDDGHEELVLVELQKTWVETETLRFRRYLGAQYNDKRNMQAEGKGTYALPTVAVYMLGHRVGDIEEPVVYCRHKVYDYNGREVTVGVPDPFVESLTHDSIIVQIPLLRGQVNNRLYEVLSVFDQTRADEFDKQIIHIDETDYDDDDMRYIVRRLTAAAADARMREDMNVEDEYFSAIENRDTAIMNRDKKIREMDARLVQQGAMIEQQDAKIEQQDAKIEQQDAKIEQQGATIEQQDATIERQGAKIEQQGAKIEQQENTIKEQQARMQGMVKAMMASGIPLEQVAEVTGIDVQELRLWV